jgi:hypothetical protein
MKRLTLELGGKSPNIILDDADLSTAIPMAINACYDRSINSSIKQIGGAERWIREHPERIFTDNKCTTPLRVAIPSSDRIKVHRVVVALGAGPRCVRHFRGGSGSLPLMSDPAGKCQSVDLFYIGEERHKGRCVHVLDDTILSLVIRELDTLSDFVRYLEQRELLFAHHAVIATGEEDLLGFYLQTVKPGIGNCFFIGDEKFDGLFVDESCWQGLTSLPQYRNSKLANRPSYVWDRLIEYFTEGWRTGTLEEGTETADLEKALRLMASTSRLERRGVGRMITVALEADPSDFRASFFLRADDQTTVFCVVVPKQPDSLIPEKYRIARQNLMIMYARTIRIRYPAIQQALVVGLKPSRQTGPHSEDLLLYDYSDWDSEIEALTREFMDELQLNGEPVHTTDSQFPLPTSREQRRRLRQSDAAKRRAEKKAAGESEV